MDRYICVHGHFYQPPRENPWLEAVETQDSAYPYHDWNARIDTECYAANATARILNGDGKITAIANNYSHISFNFGPTLLAWMQTQDPLTYQKILDADRDSQERFSGHGSALAQVYNHIIMPLANRRDKETQVIWGIADFVARFGRQPEGMWLAETAVDIETLEILAEHGITFTILAPHQAGRIRPLEGDNEWTDVGGAHIDPTRVYLQHLPSGKSIHLFFYDGPISKAIAFEDLLTAGEIFAQRLASAFDDERNWPQIVHIATDGETYGHHHRSGEMGLAYALQYIEEQGIAKLTNYGEYLAKCPPTMEVSIIENTSWSCMHGIERWRSDCGCNGGGYPQWNQQWRAPLREALDWLRESIAPIFEHAASAYFADPWATRNAYIACILDREPEQVNAWLDAQAGRPLDAEAQITALRLLEMQRNALLMYTSCGWFFDELSGIETVQVIMYAGRVTQLARIWGGDAIVEEFGRHLAAAKSNIAENGNGARIMDTWVRPAMVSLKKVTAHYAMSDLFEHYADETAIYCYSVQRLDQRVLTAGRARVLIGKAQISSRITHETEMDSFAALHFDNHNLTGGVRATSSDEEYAELVAVISEAFDHADIGETIRLLDKNFERRIYTLNMLFRDEQIKILEIIMRDEREEAESLNDQIYDRNVALLRFLAELHLPVPEVLRFASETALRHRLRQAIDATPLDDDVVRQLIREAELGGVQLHTDELSYAMELRLNAILDALDANPEDQALITSAAQVGTLAQSSPFDAHLWHAQNVAYHLAQTLAPTMRQRMTEDDPQARMWFECFGQLEEALHIAH